MICQNKSFLRSLLLIFILSSMLLTGPTYSYAMSSSDLVGESAIVIDYDSGEILFSKNPDKPMYPASTTKIMTALLTLENLQLETNVVIDGETPFTEGNRIFLFEDEIISIRDLLHALLIESANDAAVALAKAVSGDVDTFVELMNSRAMELGATNTHFANPNGLPDSEHVTTVHDMALIARKAFEDETFRELVKKVTYVIEPTEKQPEPRPLRNGNRFLWGTGGGNQIYYEGKWIDIKYPIVDGIKTGYTIAAQQCLVTTASKGGRRVITAVFKSRQNNIYLDTRKLIDFGLDEFENETLTSKGERIAEADIAGGKEPTVKAMAGETLIHSLPSGKDPESIRKEIHIDSDLSAPVKEGDRIGEMAFSTQERLIGTIPLLAENTVLEKTWKDNMADLANRINWTMLFAGLLVTYLSWRTLVTFKRLKKIKSKMQK